MSLPFADTVAVLRDMARRCEVSGASLMVVVEAGWKNKGNWHFMPYDSKAKCAALGVSQGRNHQTGILLIEMCRYFEIPVTEQPPLVKTWCGKDRKITHAELSAFAQLNKPRSNQEERDAALLAWTYANLPVRVSVRR